MILSFVLCVVFFFFKQKTAYEMRISDWSSDVCSSDLESRARDLRADAAVHEQDGTQLQRHRLLAQPFADHRVGGEGVAVAAHRVERVEVVCVRARRIGAQHVLLVVAEHHVNRAAGHVRLPGKAVQRSEEHTSELQSLMRISYAVFCLKKKNKEQTYT